MVWAFLFWLSFIILSCVVLVKFICASHCWFVHRALFTEALYCFVHPLVWYNVSFDYDKALNLALDKFTIQVWGSEIKVGPLVVTTSKDSFGYLDRYDGSYNIVTRGRYPRPKTRRRLRRIIEEARAKGKITLTQAIQQHIVAGEGDK